MAEATGLGYASEFLSQRLEMRKVQINKNNSSQLVVGTKHLVLILSLNLPSAYWEGPTTSGELYSQVLGAHMCILRDFAGDLSHSRSLWACVFLVLFLVFFPFSLNRSHVSQVGSQLPMKLRVSPASSSLVLGLETRVTTPVMQC